MHTSQRAISTQQSQVCAGNMDLQCHGRQSLLHSDRILCRLRQVRLVCVADCSLIPAIALQVSGGVAAVDQQLPRTHTVVAAGSVGECRPAQRPRRHVPRQLLRRGDKPACIECFGAASIHAESAAACAGL